MRCSQVAGMLDERMYGPGTLDATMRRRSVYFFIKRSQLIPMMMLFDWPEHLASIGQRSTTTIAPQAAAVHEQLPGPAVRGGIARELTGIALADAIDRGYRLALGRPATEAERKLAARLPGPADGGASPGRRARCGGWAARVDLCQILTQFERVRLHRLMDNKPAVRGNR